MHLTTKQLIELDTTTKSLTLLKHWGSQAAFSKVMMIRGIGYRFFSVKNDFILKQSEALQIDKARPLLDNYTRDEEELENLEDTEELPSSWDHIAEEFEHSRYLVVRAGHTSDMCLPLPAGVFIKTSKKDRKLVIYGPTKQLVFNLARHIYAYRKPSPYTGRGVRRKQIKVVRKIGKRDKK